MDRARTTAMALGLYMHSGMSFYTSWCGIVDQSTNHFAAGFLSTTFDYLHNFRMQVFFVISGFFTKKILSRGVLVFLRNRAVRLGIPFLIGVLTIGPFINSCNSYGVLKASGVSQSLLASLYDQLTASRKWRELTPHYLWFLLYLLIYSPLVAAFLFVEQEGVGVNERMNVLKRSIKSLAASKCTPLVGAIPLVIIQVLTQERPFNEVGNSFIPCLGSLLAYGCFFAYGCVLSSHLEAFVWIRERAYFNLLVGTGVWVTSALVLPHGVTVGIFNHTNAVEPFSPWIAVCSQALVPWMLTLGFLGIFLRHGNQNSQLFLRLSKMSYWVYFSHVPILMLLQVLTADWPYSWWLKLILFNVGQFGISALLFFCFLAFPWFRGCFAGNSNALSNPTSGRESGVA